MRFWLAVTAAALAFGCNSADRSGADRRQASQEALSKPIPAAPPAARGAGSGAVANDAVTSFEAPQRDVDKAPGALPGAAPAADAAAPTMIIRTGFAGVEVDTLEPAIAQLRQLTTRLGGYVANSSMQDGRDQVRQATLELKVPAARFDELTSGLRPLGRVEHVNVTAEDVGEEYTDLTARVENARRLEERLVELLATRTGKLQDVLNVERELARVRETIERLEGRLRYLKTRAAVSTLSVTLHEPLPLLTDTPGKNVIGEAFKRAWRNFVGVVAGFIASLGFLVPLAALVAVAVFLWQRYRKP